MGFEHYYTKKPASALRFFKINTVLRGFRINLETSSGVFSPRRVDRATKLLIENMIVRKDDDFLDLGCGYGVIGVVAAKLGANVVMSDVNERAVMLARKNLKLNRVKASVFLSDSFSKIKGVFDNIVLNPPMAAGMKVCTDLIASSFEHLNKKGLFQFVARHNKGGKRLESYAQELFNNVKVIAKHGGFKVYVSSKT